MAEPRKRAPLGFDIGGLLATVGSVECAVGAIAFLNSNTSFILAVGLPLFFAAGPVMAWALGEAPHDVSRIEPDVGDFVASPEIEPADES